MNGLPLVKDLMVRNPIVCHPETSVRDAVSLMENHDVGSVIVVDKYTRRPVNIITHRDVISAVYHGKFDATVGELIELLEKKELYTIGEEATVIEAMRMFEEYRIKHLPVVDNEGFLVGIITGSDILKGLPRFAFIDPLTGLENRRFLDYLDSKLSRQQVKDIYVMVIDVDNFKEINDRFGHLFGDRVLREIAQVIASSVRTNDNLIRYGGEEFLAVLYRVGEEGALAIAERIRRNVENLKIEGHPEIKLTVSVGVAPYKVSLTDTIERADRAMYSAKRKGKNRVELFKEPL
ncbi:diguanylate cyclase (GGDEF)-like protein [Hydrogenivirga caldilitoris]|uniref:diguanylate cyclase n=1 Tax=Hydrogenivirga caldilitoris TaxID=246264 RepID=A0A497XP02_9AQUI|nr:GGDEF domain-containing protein [Hydrogenivirga caldilitoris]RLJ69860.1 diguanylate cyclase (GGDEF)-like protein [Hydrogenivirga caldilitoris]